jgi:hypothetical protein
MACGEVFRKLIVAFDNGRATYPTMVPATTLSGSLDGMVISHVTARGAPESVRFWGEPPLVCEPDVAIFGIDYVVGFMWS